MSLFSFSKVMENEGGAGDDCRGKRVSVRLRKENRLGQVGPLLTGERREVVGCGLSVGQTLSLLHIKNRTGRGGVRRVEEQHGMT